MRTTLHRKPLTVLGCLAAILITGLWVVAGAVAWSGPADAEPGHGTVAEEPFTAEPAPAERPADPRFGSCAEANESGYGYYFMGEDPEYYWYDDNDGNGVACDED